MPAGRLTQERLKELLHYAPETGVFKWRVSRGSLSGSIAGYSRSNKYIDIGVDGKLYRAHRLAFLYMTGDFPPKATDIDHINQKRDDNHWANLRLVSRTVNMQNAKRNIKNASGVTGICWDKANNKWKSAIMVGYKNKNLGRYADWFEAVCARKSAEIKHGFHINHGRMC